MNPTELWKYALTGLKVFVLNIIAGAIFWLMALLFGLFGWSAFAIMSKNSMNPIVWVFAVILTLMFVALSIILGGIVAQKLWGWK